MKGLFVWGLIIWGGYALFSSDSPTENYEPSYSSGEVRGAYSENNYDNEDESEEVETFNGYECTYDCSGHEAGYEWAEDNDISDEYDCDGNSDSFNEGCTSYVEENY